MENAFLMASWPCLAGCLLVPCVRNRNYFEICFGVVLAILVGIFAEVYL